MNRPTLQLEIAYDGSVPSLRALRAAGWGKLMNMGEYRLVELPLLPFGFEHFQRRLARSSIALLAPRPDERILDAACGLGWTSAHIARSGAQVTGLDVTAPHVEAARESFGGKPGLRFVRGDMRSLRAPASEVDVPDESLDAVHCLEGAFHLGTQGRAEFLAEAWRVLRPGGRLVLVDFTWADEHPERIAEFDPKRSVRDTWQFEEFEPLERYKRRAAERGFALERCEDWSTRVTGRFVKICYLLTWLGRFSLGRAVLQGLFPELRKLEESHWPWLFELTRDHDRVRKESRYTAFVWRKPER